MSPLRVLSVGNTCLDIVMRYAEDLPRWGEEQVFEKSEERLGGQGANFALATAGLGCRTWLFSNVGNDRRSDELKSTLKSVRNLDCGLLRTEKSETGYSVASVNNEGERFFMTFMGHQALFSLRKGSRKALSLVERGDLVHVSGYFLMPRAAEELPRFVSDAKAKGATVSFDPGWSADGLKGRNVELFWKVLDSVDWFLPNEAEAEALGGRGSLDKAVGNIERRFRGRTVVKTGAMGCEVFENGRVASEIPGFRVDVSDAVGAGDAFDAGFLAGIGSGFSVSSSARMGNAAAALAISSRNGLGTRFPSLSKVLGLAGLKRSAR